MKNLIYLFKMKLLCVFIFSFYLTNAQTPPTLGAASNYGLLASDSIVVTDSLRVFGDAGAANFIHPKVIAENKFTSISSAQTALAGAKSYCSGLTATGISGTLDGQTLTAGVYSVSGNASLTDTLVLSGDTNDIFIITITGDLTVNASAFTNIGNLSDVLPKNIYWNVGGKIILKAGSRISGVFLAGGDINVQNTFGGFVCLLTQQTIHVSNVQYDVAFGYTVFAQPLYEMRSGGGYGCPPSSLTCNVVSNPGFEIFTPCPQLYGDLDDACDWQDFLNWNHNPHYLNLCELYSGCNDTVSGGCYGFVNNAFGVKTAHTGNAYSGFGAYMYMIGGSFSGTDENWYTRKLSTPLLNGQAYYIEFWMCLASGCNKACPLTLEVTQPYPAGFPYINMGLAPKMDIGGSTTAETAIAWTKYSMCYTPTTSTDQTMVIRRDYATSTLTNVTPTTTSAPICDVHFGDNAYYFLDDWKVSRLSDAGSDVATCSTATIGNTGCSPIAGATYAWTAADAFTAANATITSPSSATTNVTTTVNGTYTFAITTTYGGCSSSDNVIVTNNSFTVVANATPNTINMGSTSSLGATSTPSVGITYVWSPGGMTGTPVVVSPVATTTYTVNAINSFGCTATDTTVVHVVYPQCNITLNYVITGPTTSAAIFGGATTVVNNANISLSGDLTINNPTLTFTNCNFLMADSTARIIVPKNRILTLDQQTHLYSCSSMWHGIIIHPEGKLIGRGSAFIEDALSAVASKGGGVYDLNTVIFNRNLRGIEVMTFSGTHTGTVVNSIFSCRYIPSFANPSSNYSVAALKGIITPLTGFPIAKMKSPYSIELSVYGVNPKNVNDITIGKDSPGVLNIFDALKCGIYLDKTTATIYNNVFQNMLNPYACPISCFSTLDGYGIKTNGTTSGSYNITVGGTGPNQGNIFSNCYRGIDIADFKNADIRKNSFFNSSTGSGVPPYLGDAGIIVKPAKNNTIYIDENTITNCITGIRINRIGTSAIDALALEVNTNLIQANVNGYCNNGIYVTDLLSGTIIVPSPSTIIDNIINECGTGINISNSKKIISIKTNSITTRYAKTGNINGIKVAGGQNLIIENNHTKYDVGTAAVFPTGNITAYGIYLQNSTNMIVKCNLIEDAGRSMVFEGACSSPTTSGYGITQNTMRRAQDGFVLKNSGVIGQQGAALSPANNYWDRSVIPNFTRAQTYTDATTGANTTSKLYMNNVTTGSFATLPISNQTNGGAPDIYVLGTGLNTTTGTPIACGSVPAYILHDDSDHPILRDYAGDTTFLDYLEELASDTVNLDYYPDAVNWQLDNYTYNAIRSDSSLLSSSDLDSFYTSQASSPIGQFTSTNDYIENNDYASAVNLNTNIATTNTLEQNQQTVNSIILARLQDSTYVYDSADVALLETIADQCPVAGGDAVYQSRHLLMDFYDQVLEFEDNCDEDKRNIKPEILYQPAKSNLFSMYPNPNNGSMTFSYRLGMNETGTLKILDPLGQPVCQYALSSGANQLAMGSNNFSNGIYLYIVNVNGKLVYTNKIIVIK